MEHGKLLFHEVEQVSIVEHKERWNVFCPVLSVKTFRDWQGRLESTERFAGLAFPNQGPLQVHLAQGADQAWADLRLHHINSTKLASYPAALPTYNITHLSTYQQPTTQQLLKEPSFSNLFKPFGVKQGVFPTKHPGLVHKKTVLCC